MTLTLRRSNPQALADDFKAVSELLERRKAQRTPSKQSAVNAAEKILKDSA
jgi:hypothetical protein